jgi:oxygen-dependent protoporphyrinogen oxidase
MGLALGDRVLTSGRAESYVLRLPLSIPERLAFARAGLRLRRAVARRRRLATAAPGEPAERARERALAFLGDETFAEFLGELPPRVAAIFACAAHRATAEPDVLSAGCGAGLFALVWGGKSSLIASNLIGGSSRLPEAVGEALGDRVRLRARALAISEDDDGARVHYELDGTPAQVRAGQVIVAAPGPHAGPLLAEIAPEAAAALSSLTYGPFVSMAIETNESQPMPWDGTYAIATPGHSFDLFTNQAHVLRDGSPRRRGGSLMVFAGGQSAGRLLEQPDQAISRTFLNVLHSLYPETRGVIADTVVGRWPLGNVFATPGRHTLTPALEGPLGRNGRVHLAGDYFGELGTMETAAATGTAAAKRADAALTKAFDREERPTHVA